MTCMVEVEGVSRDIVAYARIALLVESASLYYCDTGSSCPHHRGQLGGLSETDAWGRVFKCLDSQSSWNYFDVSLHHRACQLPYLPRPLPSPPSPTPPSLHSLRLHIGSISPICLENNASTTSSPLRRVRQRSRRFHRQRSWNTPSTCLFCRRVQYLYFYLVEE